MKTSPISFRVTEWTIKNPTGGVTQLIDNSVTLGAQADVQEAIDIVTSTKVLIIQWITTFINKTANFEWFKYVTDELMFLNLENDGGNLNGVLDAAIVLTHKAHVEEFEKKKRC